MIPAIETGTAIAPQIDVLRGRDMLCFSHDWNGDPLSKTHLMRLLARDNRILWVNSIGYRMPTATASDLNRAWRKLAATMRPLEEVEPNIFVLNPLAVPAYGTPSIRTFNRQVLRWQVLRAMRKLGFSRPINWIFNPAAAVIARSLGEDMLIYYCVDEYTQFTGVASEGLAKIEADLMVSADLVVVSAERLYATKSPYNRRTVLVRHGVDHAHFCRAVEPSTLVPDEIARLPRPVIGFFGLIADWVDTELIGAVADRFAEGSLVLIGKATTDISALTRRPNVHYFGRKPYSSLPSYCKGFDVALMPFRINELTLNANPLKVREYLSAGLPVVSTAIPEVAVLGECRIGATREQFISEVEGAIADRSSRIARSERMRKESWEARLDEIRRHLVPSAAGRFAS